jgi:FdhD protein
MGEKLPQGTQPTPPVRRSAVERAVRFAESTPQPEIWQVAAEVAVELDVNGVPVTVTMATPADLEDLAVGLAYTEGVVTDPAAIETISVIDSLDGVVVDLTVADAAVNDNARRARLLEGRSGCGLCGVDTLAAAMRRPLPRLVQETAEISNASLQAAFAALPAQQPLNQLTHSVHAAAWCTLSGEIICVREDVGRHNALDKLAGWLLRDPAQRAPGFVVLSSRLSFELVCKAAAMGAVLLAAVSAPTALALEIAANAELPLACLGPGNSIARF